MTIKDIPAAIRKRIDEKGMTIRAVAEKAGLYPQSLSAMLRYKQKNNRRCLYQPLRCIGSQT